MAILRKIGKFFGGLIFFFALSGLISSLGMVQLTSYNTMKPIFVNMIGQQMSSQNLSEMQTGLLQLCNVSGNETLELPFGGTNLESLNTTEGVTPEQEGSMFGISTNQTLKINCTELAAMPQQDLSTFVAGAMVGNFFDSFYNQDFECKAGVPAFIDCIRSAKDPTILFSARGNLFFNEIINYILAVLLLGGILLGICTKGIGGRLRAFGVPCLFIGAGYFVMSFALPLIQTMMPIPAEARGAIQPLMNSIVGIFSKYLLPVFFVGLGLTIAGVAVGIIEKKKGKKETGKEVQEKLGKEKKEKKK